MSAETDAKPRERAQERAARQKLVDRLVRFSWRQQLAYSSLMAVAAASIVYWFYLTTSDARAADKAVMAFVLMLVAATIHSIGQRVDALAKILQKSGALRDFVAGGL